MGTLSQHVCQTLLVSFCLLVCSVSLSHARSIKFENQTSFENDTTKVFQTGSTTGYVQSNSTAFAVMLASGSPAGILNVGGTTTTFSGSSTVYQHLPSNTSSSVGGSLSAHCGGGQLGTLVTGQQGIGLHSVGDCDSYVVSKS